MTLEDGSKQYQCDNCCYGYYWDGECCTSCENIDSNCETCTHGGERCLSCTSGFIPEADGQSCRPDFCNCDDNTLGQPHGVINYGDKMGTLFCYNCSDNYFWDPTAMSGLGDCKYCQTLDIPNCEICESLSTCKQCLPGYYLEFDKTECKPFF